jgi:hypothetical protein
MLTSQVEKEKILEFRSDYYQNQIQAHTLSSAKKFSKILKSYIIFNAIFCSLIAAEVFYFFFYLSVLVQTFVVAINLALIFATLFSYFTLKLYFQTKKTERCLALKNQFIQKSKEFLNYQEGIHEYHLALANACCKFAAVLHGLEYTVLSLPSWMHFLSSPIEKLSCWGYWQDVHFMKEILLQASVDEHIKIVQAEPTDLEAHASLANAYVMLSGLYVDPRTVEGLDEDRWIPPNKYKEDFKQKFRQTAERAIEEFKILSDYAPNDPWVHAQLAYSYHDLQMPKEEIREYETILRLCPDDKETLFKLGKLYFEQGFNAKGLQIYETLKKSNYKKAENLIHFYGSYNS